MFSKHFRFQTIQTSITRYVPIECLRSASFVCAMTTPRCTTSGRQFIKKSFLTNGVNEASNYNYFVAYHKCSQKGSHTDRRPNMMSVVMRVVRPTCHALSPCHVCPLLSSGCSGTPLCNRVRLHMRRQSSSASTPADLIAIREVAVRADVID